MQLRVLGYLRLDEQGRGTAAHACGQPVDKHVPDVLLDVLRSLVVRCQGMPVGSEEETLVLVLQTDPVFQYAVVVTQMQAACWAHT